MGLLMESYREFVGPILECSKKSRTQDGFLSFSIDYVYLFIISYNVLLLNNPD